MARSMERLMECLGLCLSLSLLEPRHVCLLRCCCKVLQAMPVSWLEYKYCVHLPPHSPSAYCWLLKNIHSVKIVDLEDASEEQLVDLLQVAKALSDVTIGDSSTSRLPKLPQQLGRLFLLSCNLLAELQTWPTALKVLNCSYCECLKELPPSMDTALQELSLHGCHVLTTIPDVPDTLQQLECSYCWRLAQLPCLPSGLMTLCLKAIPQLQVRCCHSTVLGYRLS
eukprot:GHUV01017124.1.p1 GENE.GHUV01017124.1~~GHUV01017124.1.p1  ORF type:complete len:225 (+),score=43.12 GHUV01017124.1:625-1299(+)